MVREKPDFFSSYLKLYQRNFQNSLQNDNPNLYLLDYFRIYWLQFYKVGQTPSSAFVLVFDI